MLFPHRDLRKVSAQPAKPADALKAPPPEGIAAAEASPPRFADRAQKKGCRKAFSTTCKCKAERGVVPPSRHAAPRRSIEKPSGSASAFALPRESAPQPFSSAFPSSANPRHRTLGVNSRLRRTLLIARSRGCSFDEYVSYASTHSHMQQPR